MDFKDIDEGEILSIDEINGWCLFLIAYGLSPYAILYDKPYDVVLSQKLKPFAFFEGTEKGIEFAQFVCENKG